MITNNLSQKELEYYDGECFITFNLLNVSSEKPEAEIAVSDRGRISVLTYDLFQDTNGDFYFEFKNAYNKIYLKNFI